MTNEERIELLETAVLLLTDEIRKYNPMFTEWDRNTKRKNGYNCVFKEIEK